MKKIIVFLSAILVTFTACDKLLEDPEMNITLDTNNTYKTGEIIRFNIDGNPDYITFYSGESGYNYDDINRNEADPEGLTIYLEFDAKVERQTAQSLNTLKVLFSTEFPGLSGNFDEDSLKIVQTNWTDKSEECNFSTDRNVTVPVKLNLTEFAGKETCIAFRYEGYIAGQPKWTLSDIRLTMQYEDGTEFSGMSPTDMGFLPIDLYNKNNKPYLSSNDLGRWNTSTPSVSLIMTNTSTGKTDNLDYAISQPIIFNKVTPDKGISVKDPRDRKEFFEYQFSAPGKYNVVFVGRNLNFDGEKKIIKKFEVEITE